MKKIQEVFNRIQDIKKEQKDIKIAYSDTLKGSASYQDILAQLKSVQEKKKQVELTIKAKFEKEISRLEDLKEDLLSDTMLLTDIAISQIAKGQPIEITDKYENEYEPIFSVKFKKRK